MEWFDVIVTISTLTVLEIVLGIDNLVFLTIISQRLPAHQQARARKMGLMFAWVTRLLLLLSAIWLTTLTTTLFTIAGNEISIRDIFLFGGGLFLLTKATQEMHSELEPSIDPELEGLRQGSHAFWLVISQIALIDILFSFDSILTAISLTGQFWIMAVAITIAILCMIFASEPLNRLIERHPTIKMIALSFILLIGVMLIADSLSYHIPRGYLYFAMSFSVFVEILNIVRRKRYLRLEDRKLVRRD